MPVICLLAFVSYTRAQNKRSKADSLAATLKSASEDSSRSAALMALGAYFQRRNPDTSIYYYRQAITIAAKVNDTLIKGEAIRNIGWDNLRLGKYRIADSLFKQVSLLISGSSTRKFQILKGSLLCNIGTLNSYEGNFSQALVSFLKAQKIFHGLDDKPRQAVTLGNIGSVYREEGNYPQALEYGLKALGLYRETNNKRGEGSELGNIGNLYASELNYPQALDYVLQSLKIQEVVGDKYGEANNFGNIGNIYTGERNYSSGIEYYMKALKVNQELGDKDGEAINFGNMGVAYFEENNYSLTLENYMKALNLEQEIGDKESEAGNLNCIGQLYMKEHQFALAVQYLSKGLALSNSIHTLGTTRDIELSYSSLDSALSVEAVSTQQWRPAIAYSDSSLAHYKRYISLCDSITNQKNFKKQAYLEANFEFQTKEDALKATQEKKDLAAREAKKQERILTGAISAMLVMVMLFAIFVVQRLRITLLKCRDCRHSELKRCGYKQVSSKVYEHYLKTTFLTDNEKFLK